MFIQKRILIFVILFIDLINLINAKVHVEKIELEQYDKDYLQVKTDIRQDGDVNVIDVEADLLQDLDNSIFIQIHIQKKIDNEFKTLFKSDLIDQCHYIDNQEKYPQIRMLLEDLKKYGNILQSCPFKKGKYYLKGFKFEAKEDFIHLLSPGDYCIHFTMFKDFDGNMKEMYSVKWIATIE